MESETQTDSHGTPANLRVWHVLAWAVAFVLLGGLMWSTATSQCLCGHSAMNAPLGLSIFAAFTGGGVLVGRRLAAQGFGGAGRGVAAAIGLMFIGTFAALVLAGNDLTEAHDNMFKPANASVTSQVTF